MTQSDDDKGFTVSDRRKFTADGEPIQPGPEEEPAAEPKSKSTQADRSASQAEAGSRAAASDEGPLPEMTFASFIFSLSTSALMHLGAIPDPATGQSSVNLPLAKQTIDLLGILKEKTAGNLDESESKLLDGVLFDVRMRYVEAASGSGK